MPDTEATIAITGAGSGLGRALAHRFSSAGYAVAVTDIVPGRAEAVLESITGKGGRGFSQSLDVTRGADWDALYQRILTEWGRLDVLVNNAGVIAAGRLEDSTIDDWQWVLDINLNGVVRGCHRFVPMLREQASGHIVNMASIAGLVQVPELSAYGTSKAAVVAISEHLRVDLEGSGVGVSVVCPAYVHTGLLENFRSKNPQHLETAERWMKNSRVSADDVAEKVFAAVRKNRFLVLTHPETRSMLRFKRWFPGMFFRSMVRAKHYLGGK